MRPRRYLPSIKLLMAVDAVVRHRSVTAAAEELKLTQSTVSRLILSLEHQLGKDLFSRRKKRLIPTAAALAYQREVSAALDLIQKASTTVAADPDGDALSLAVLPTFGTRWLAPRLGAFLKAQPGTVVNLATRCHSSDFTVEGFDAAIYFGEAAVPGSHYIKLFDEKATACASPGFIAEHDLSRPSCLAGHTLLHLATRRNAWGDWFTAHDVADRDEGGMLVDQFSMMIRVAVSGVGVALLPEYIAETEIAEGRLQPLHRRAVRMSGAYWLAWPAEKDDFPPLRAFRSWLQEQIADLT